MLKTTGALLLTLIIVFSLTSKPVYADDIQFSESRNSTFNEILPHGMPLEESPVFDSVSSIQVGSNNNFNSGNSETSLKESSVLSSLSTVGTPWAWGDNEYGQLGNGNTSNSFVPTRVAGLSGAIFVIGNYTHSLALKSDGTVWAWGQNDRGQLGNGTTIDTYYPVQVNGLSGVTAIAGGSLHSLALKSDGTVWAWGESGQLGNGTNDNSPVPVQVNGLSGVITIAGGSLHSLALKSNGTVWAWGYNYNGQLGNGTNTDSNYPVQVNGLTGVTAIAGGEYHTLALKSNGTVWAWGFNNCGQLGNGYTNYSPVPVQVSSLNEITAIAAGSDHSLALKSDGTVWAWGYNVMGQLGNGSVYNSYVPVQVNSLTGVTAIAGGGYHSLALKSNTTVWTWGYNNYGQLGNGTNSDSYYPVQVNGLSGITTIDGSIYYSLARKSDGSIWTWGCNSYGQLGNGFTGGSANPSQVSGLSSVTTIAGGGSHSLALKSDGTVWTWGANSQGQLGNGINTDSYYPVQVNGLTGVTAIAGGLYHSLALKSNGTVWAWGENFGQLGNGTTNNSDYPVQVNGLSGVMAIAAGGSHSLALKSDGTVWTWGINNFGQLGNGTTNNSLVPVQVNGLTGVTAIAGGLYHSLALKSNGTVWGWGDNGFGELGNGTTISSYYPIQVSSLAGVIAIAGGLYHSLALKSDGTIWVWGYNRFGQLGNGTTIDTYYPVRVTGLSGVTAIAGGSFHSLALKSDGTVWAWGYNYFGQLGNGTYNDSNIPVQATSLSGIVSISSSGSHSLALKANIPAAPTLISPADGATVSGTSVTFQWSASSGATNYWLAVTKVSDNSIFLNKAVGNVTSDTETGFPNDGTTYKWVVAAGNSAGWGNASSARTFTNASALILSVDDSLSNGTIQVTYSGSDLSNVTVRVKSNKPYWSNLYITSFEGIVPKPVDLVTKACNLYQVIPPGETLTYSVDLSSGGNFTFMADLTMQLPDTGANAAALNLLSVLVQLIDPMAYCSGVDVSTAIGMFQNMPDYYDVIRNFGQALDLKQHTSLSDRLKYLVGSAKGAFNLLSTHDNQMALAQWMGQMNWFTERNISVSQISGSLGKITQYISFINIFWQEGSMIWDATVGQPAGTVLVKAVPARTQYVLTTSISPAGGGVVSPTGGNFDNGSTLTLYAWPSVGYTFDHWSGDSTGVSSSTSITMNSNKNAVANFIKIQKPDLTVSPVLFDPPSASAGQTLAISFVVKNIGGSSSGSFYYRLSLGTTEWGTDFSLGNFAVNSLGPGETQTVSITSNPIPSGISPGSYYVTAFSDGYQQISEQNEMNNIGSSTPQKLSIADYPSPPVLTSPLDGATVPGTSITFQWAASNGATNYWLAVLKASDNSVLINKAVGNITSDAESGFPNDGTAYKWMVAAGNSAGWGNASTMRTFNNGTAVTIPAAPSLMSPADGATVAGTSVTFQWSASSGATNYWLVVQKSSDNTTLINKAVGNVTSDVEGGFPNDGTAYKWMLAAGNSAGWSSVSTVRTFTNASAVTIPTAPSLTSPADGATVTGSSVTFQWSASSGATNYWLVVQKSSDNSVLINKAVGNVTSDAEAGFLNDGTAYKWVVAAGNSAGWGSASTIRTFTNGTVSVPAAPSLTSPADGASVSGTSVTFQWAASSGATNYWLAVFKSSDNSVIINKAVGNVLFDVESGFPNNGTEYKWVVAAGNSAGWGSASTMRTFTNGTVSVPAAPSLTSPADGASVTGTSVTFQWAASSGATNYWLAVLKASDNSVIINKAVGNVTSDVESGFPNNGTQYKWIVAAGNSSGWGNASTLRSFTNGTISVPAAPSLTSPADGAKVTGTSVTFQWTASNGATNYWLAVVKASDNSVIINRAVGNVTSDTETGFPNNGTQYKWVVAAGNSAGWGNASTTRVFTNGP
jgi:alpha-tubulin suppressor-like RCC1 family protein